jgi:hypothetical protein
MLQMREAPQEAPAVAGTFLIQGANGRYLPGRYTYAEAAEVAPEGARIRTVGEANAERGRR